MRPLACLPVLLFAIAVPPANLVAQSTPPRTYSFTQDPAVSLMGPSIVKVVRDGAREAVDQILPVGPGREKEFHNHILYDFQARKIYTKIVSDSSVPCSVMDYTSPAAPAEFDMITGSADSLKDFLAHATLVRKETLNGIPANVMEASSGEMKMTIWIADPGGFPVKEVMVAPGAPATTLFEVKNLSLAKPPASAFTPPKGCKTVQGEATATGVHAELGSDSPAPKPTVNVTAVTLADTPNYSGACPVRIKLTGAITADGPGKVFYRFAVGEKGPGATVTFPAAGTKTVSHVFTFKAPDPGFGNTTGVLPLLEAIGEDAQGKHDDFGTKGANNSGFSVTCTSTVAAPVNAPPSQAVSAVRTATPEETPQPASSAPARVTEVHLQVTPAEYSGTCPVKVKLVGTLKADGPGTAYFQFQAGAIGANREGTVQVAADGAATVTSEGTLRMTPGVQSVRFLAGMEPRGHQENAQWADVDLNLHCGVTP